MDTAIERLKQFSRMGGTTSPNGSKCDLPGKFDNKSTAEERDAFLKTLLEATEAARLSNLSSKPEEVHRFQHESINLHRKIVRVSGVLSRKDIISLELRDVDAGLVHTAVSYV